MIDDFLQQVVEWFGRKPDVRGVALVGSHARGTARPDSDVDLVILADEPRAYLDDTAWARQFGRVRRDDVEDWGAVESLRVRYRIGLEVEYGFAIPLWARLPLDPGTKQVLAAGARVLIDRDELLGRAVEAAR